MMRTMYLIFFSYFIFSCHQKEQSLKHLIDENLNLAVKQYKLMEASLPDSLLPYSSNPDGTLKTCNSSWWTSGFYPGTLRYLFQYSGDPEIKKIAEQRSKLIEKEKYNDGDHDIGFRILCSFGNAWKVTQDSDYYHIITTAATTLTHRYNPVVGCIRSWDSVDDTTQFRVIVDNMMNLELLFWAAKQTGDSSFYKIAVSHANKTIKDLYRPDGSSYHLVNYDQKTGKVIYKKTVQGYSDESAWSRGQAWGLYGFVIACRETGDKHYLQQAQKIAGFILNHPNLPDDCVPYWDFNAPDIPDAKHDVSAAAIMASAMIELSGLSDKPQRMRYLSYAETAIETLSSPQYRSREDGNNNFLLKHGVANMPGNSEIDAPLIYADYYYVEALLRLKNYLNN